MVKTTKRKDKSDPGKKKGRGRPSEYSGQYCDQVIKLLALGATMEQIAEFFEVSVSALKRWMVKHKEFRTAICNGRIQADAEVAHSLYQRAVGYSHPAVKIFADPKSGAGTTVRYTEHYPPDTPAAKFWLTNRQRKLWKDRFDVEHKGLEGLADRMAAARRRVDPKNAKGEEE